MESNHRPITLLRCKLVVVGKHFLSLVIISYNFVHARNYVGIVYQEMHV